MVDMRHNKGGSSAHRRTSATASQAARPTGAGLQLDDLLSAYDRDETAINRVGGRIALASDTLTPTMRDTFRTLIEPLENQPFWTAAEGQDKYVPQCGLWAPQRRAVGLGISYLAAWRTKAVEKEAALIKMPTGTGKTAVIATLACALPNVKRTLVITPRRALVDQLQHNLHNSMWGRFDAIYDGQGVRARRAGDPEIGTVSNRGPVWRMLPSNAKELLDIKSERVVLVGTFGALEQILRPERPAHRLSGLRPNTKETIPPDGREKEPVVSQALLARLAKFLRDFDLVIVDESHYEPAFVWSQCIRTLALPTILLSATPYRNDFRYFSISGRFVFNLSFDEAVERKLIRPVEPITGDELGADENSDFVDRLGLFAAHVAKKTKLRDGQVARIILRGEDHTTLLDLARRIENRLGERAVLIHHREVGNNAKTFRFNSATAALKAPETAGVRFWLHQWKLLEGVDENRFVGVAIRDGFDITRAIVQQIGRLLRYSDRAKNERAFIMTAADIEDDTFERFDRYLKYEEYFDKNPGEALSREAKLFDMMRDVAPDYQYVSGDFRDRLDLDGDSLKLLDFQIPCRALIFRNTRSLSLDELARQCMEALGIEDRHDAKVLKPDVGEPNNVRLIPYVSWQNSELLLRHALPTWELGVFVIVAQGERVFLLDTQKFVIDPEPLGLEQEPIEALRRLVPRPTQALNVRVTQASTISLDLSDVGIRSVTARMRDFRNGFFDLSESMQAATSVRASLNRGGARTGRYLSLMRSSVSDSSSDFIPLDQYVAWTALIAESLDNSRLRVNETFRRFADSQPAPSADKAAPRNILFDFADLFGPDGSDRPDGWIESRTKDLLDADLCLDVDDQGGLEIKFGDQTFDMQLDYAIAGTVRRRGKYRVSCDGLDEYLLEEREPKSAKPQVLSKLLTQTQAFRVVPTERNLVFAQKHFYRPGVNFDAIANEEPGNPLEWVVPSAWLGELTSEKGNGTSSVADWANLSIFGGIYGQLGRGDRGAASRRYRDTIRKHDANFAKLIDQFDLIVCDDGGAEFCDFVCVSKNEKRVVLIHAKADDTVKSLNSLQAVGRQAMASLAFLTRTHPPDGRKRSWSTPVSIKNGQIAGRILSADRYSADQAWTAVEEALMSANYAREIWIVAGRILSRATLKRELARHPPGNQELQMIYYLAALQTSAARANVRLQLFCSP
jgi:superfamily II DNA or RNA helicase